MSKKWNVSNNLSMNDSKATIQRLTQETTLVEILNICFQTEQGRKIKDFKIPVIEAKVLDRRLLIPASRLCPASPSALSTVRSDVNITLASFWACEVLPRKDETLISMAMHKRRWAVEFCCSTKVKNKIKLKLRKG